MLRKWPFVSNRTMASALYNSYDFVLAIAREESSVWERRAPFSPLQVQQMVRSGIRVIVQPSTRRAYTTQEYKQAGAIIQDDISEASAIVGIKSIPIDHLIADKTYTFFSHTIKAQPANMPLLDAILQKRIRLVDYEKMVNLEGRRVVAFGKYAGTTGMINILHGIGLRLLAFGHHTPFMHIGTAHNYPNSSAAKAAIASVAREIEYGLLPEILGPMTFVFTGRGNVSQGAQEVFKHLPVEMVDPAELENVVKTGDTRRVYGAIVRRRDYLVRKDGAEYDKEDLKRNPDMYESNFARKIAPFTSVLINGMYWDVRAPRLLMNADARRLLVSDPNRKFSPGEPTLPHRLLAICDISADIGGSIEFMTECTTIDDPFVVYNATTNKNIRGDMSADGVLVSSIDNMPAQLPREATDFFGSQLSPYIEEILRLGGSREFRNAPVSCVVKDAVIAYNGFLAPNYEYIADLRRENETANESEIMAGGAPKQKVLILGSGHVSGPVVEYLARDPDRHLTIASAVLSEASDLASKYSNARPIYLAVDSGREANEQLEKLIEQHDVVISLLPNVLHPHVAQMCIRHKTNMVTASYSSEMMKKLNEEAKSAGITILNEVGLDPGIDHLLAIECVSEAKRNGGEIVSFESWCGGLPAPEYCDNPLRYKFTWSPRTVLHNMKNAAKYIRNGQVVDVQPGGWLLRCVQPMDIVPGFSLEGYPNRDSTIYVEKYGLETAHTILRGTLRYKGFGSALDTLFQSGLLSGEKHPLLQPDAKSLTWLQLMRALVAETDVSASELKSRLFDRFERNHEKLEILEQLGLLSNEPVHLNGSPLDALCSLLTSKYDSVKGERDLCLLLLLVGIKWKDGSTEKRRISLIEYGNDKFTAMAKLVGLPTAMAAEMILEGDVMQKGVVEPIFEDIARPLLRKLRGERLKFESKKI
ncbi:alpha-aminoadipic semialdehyde synthase, mitochondrial-like [Oscarella lobularis]|uniref:alpha-aminoadipic semialdehyde synthase, mitochondrial-like n=1 Tax=Oscarella lobularis TaxID=121494 RepID=UPI0033144314